jgi:hypothetical protein
VLERFAEEGFCRDCLDASVEGGEAQFLQRLVEIAVNQGRADRELGLAIGNLAEIILE